MNALQIIKELVYDKLDFEIKNLKTHSEGAEYGACSFELNGLKIEHRVAKITPTKVGQFVTIWKRNEHRDLVWETIKNLPTALPNLKVVVK